MREPMLLLMAWLAALAPCLHAQRMVAGPAHFGPTHFGPHIARGEHSRAFFYPLAYGDPFYSDYITTASVASQPPVVILANSANSGTSCAFPGAIAAPDDRATR